MMPPRSRDIRRSKRHRSAVSHTIASPARRRRSARGVAAIHSLAERIVKNEKIVIVSGAGLSVASGVRPFRSNTGCQKTAVPSKYGVPPTKGLWNDVIWTTATREAFRKDACRWYNEFWLPHFGGGETYQRNSGHMALQELQKRYSNIYQITQNIDGLQHPSERLIEAHGRLGLYKCLPNDDSDMDSESEDDDDRQVHLGHRRKSRVIRDSLQAPTACPYQYLQSLTPCQLEPDDARMVLEERSHQSNPLAMAPTCPTCGSLVMPQALLFDEEYHSHAFYNFELAEDWLSECQAIVFVGTSFAVRLTSVVLEHAREHSIPVYNFNLHDLLLSTARLNVSNIVGPAVETLPRLVEICLEVEKEQKLRCKTK